MNWLEFFSKLVDSIMWPIASIVIVFALRGSVKKIIEGRLFSFKVGNVEINFDKLLEQVNENLDEGNTTDELELANKKESSEETEENSKKDLVERIKQRDLKREQRELEKEQRKRIQELISEDPKKGIVFSWRMVKKELLKLGVKNGLTDIGYVNTTDIFYSLIKNDVISNRFYSALANLSQIAIIVNMKKNDYEWTEKEAESFLTSCMSAVRRLRDINSDYERR
ncbi:hypothetical protein V6Z54_17785 [Bacillus sp. MAG717A]|uniref:hypothetical protein n=1 Tax=Bacillus TaxID=1386 RepID=UPI0005ADF646|nr:hypothetical protein [Bacillus safensis]KIL18105.1 hypothetical protein B4129_1162 [Bacillus safensis]